MYGDASHSTAIHLKGTNYEYIDAFLCDSLITNTFPVLFYFRNDWNPPIRYETHNPHSSVCQPEGKTGWMFVCLVPHLIFWYCCFLGIIGSEESSSSPVVRSGDRGAGGGSSGTGNSTARKKKYAPNEQGRYVCTQCGRSYAAYHVKIFCF